jgi:hypothetical protein
MKAGTSPPAPLLHQERGECWVASLMVYQLIVLFMQLVILKIFLKDVHKLSLTPHSPHDVFLLPLS